MTMTKKDFEAIARIIKVHRDIEKVKDTEGMNFVFDKTGDVLLLFADPKYDITNAVLDRLKRG